MISPSTAHDTTTHPNGGFTALFPGQGSQKAGMGEGLFDKYPKLTAIADKILGYSIKDLCLNDSAQNLSQTQYTQPALYVVNALTYQDQVVDKGLQPSFLAGHSLGEFNALYAAKVFDFETGLRIVQKRGAIMSTISGGGMAAVIGLSEEKVRELLSGLLGKKIDIANINSSKQIVISGLQKDVLASEQSFLDAGAQMFIRLNVSGAFHSRYMMEAAGEFSRFLEQFSFAAPKTPVISNVEAALYDDNAAKICALITGQMTASVRWCESIQSLLGEGQSEFREIGPGTVLGGLITRITAESPPLNKGLLIEWKKQSLRRPTPLAETKEANQLNGDRSLDRGAKPNTPSLLAPQLGAQSFRDRYGLRLSYASGSMYRGISSVDMVVRMANAGLMSFLGTGGFSPEEIKSSITLIKKRMNGSGCYGMNLLCNLDSPDDEIRQIETYIKHGINLIEASAFLQITPAIVLFRLKGLKPNADDSLHQPSRIIAKVSRPEVAESFLSPAPRKIIDQLIQSGKITEEEGRLGESIPIASDITVEADSGGHTDQGNPYTLLPAMITLRNRMVEHHGYQESIHIGAAGGIGTPEAAAAAFMLGADYVQTGSINQCTVEAGISDQVKSMLESINVQDTAYAPAGDMFEIGAKVQVLRKGVFFPARANKLYELYRQHKSIDEIDPKTRKQLEDKYFKRTLEDIWQETSAYLQKKHPKEHATIVANPKQKMAWIFRSYFAYSTRLAFEGKKEATVDFQVHTGPALGAFNQWVKGTPLESWRNRHVDELADKLMHGSAKIITRFYTQVR